MRLEDPAHDVLVQVLAGSALRSAVSGLLGDSWALVVNRHNHVVVDRGAGSRAVRVHRDLLHWSRNPVTLLVMLDCDESDPAAWPSVLPGSHLWPVEGSPNGGGYWLDETPQRELATQTLKVPLRPGDALFMDGMTYHSAGTGSVLAPRVMASLCLRPFDELTGEVGTNEEPVAGLPRYAGQSRWRSHV